MIIATTNEIPGYEIDEVYGEVFGLTVRSRNMFSQFGAGLTSIIGGGARWTRQRRAPGGSGGHRRATERAVARGS